MKDLGVQMVVVGTKEIHECKEEEDNFFFFWIGYRNFIDKMNIVFMMMNTLDVKKIQKTQELKLAANKL